MCAIATQVLAGGESIVAVAAELGVCRATVYEWRDMHPEFEKAIKAGLAAAQPGRACEPVLSVSILAGSAAYRFGVIEKRILMGRA